MATDLLSQSAARPAASLPVKDKVVVGLILMFNAVALTIELYWILHHQDMEGRSDLFARIIQLYWPADSSWRLPGYSIAKAFTLSYELVNVVLTPILSAVLLWGIFKHRRYRYPLQLLIATYTTYGTFLCFTVAHISGYAQFADHSVGA